MTEGRGSCIPVQRHNPDSSAADAEQIFALLQQPAVVFRIPACHILQRQFQHKRLTLTGGKFTGLGISAKLPKRLDEFSIRRGTIKLHSLFSGEVPGIPDFCFDGYDPIFRRKALTRCFKFRIAQAITEGKDGLGTRCVIIAVSDENPFLIPGIIPLSKVSDRHDVVSFGPGRGELAGGIGLAQQHVRKGVAGHAAQLAQKQHIFHLIQHGRNIHRTAHVQHQHEFSVLFDTAQDVPFFVRRQQIIARIAGTISAFSGVAGKDVNADISFSLDGKIILRFSGRTSHADKKNGFPEFFCFFGYAFVEALNHRFPCGFISFHPGLGGNGEACILQPFFNADIMPHIHITAAGAAFDGFSCA